MSETSRILDETVIRPATGCGPNAGGAFSQEDDHHPSAGWGASKSVASDRRERRPNRARDHRNLSRVEQDLSRRLGAFWGKTR